MKRTIAKCLLTGTLFLINCSQKSTVDLVITNISIIDIKDGSLHANSNIIINNGLIVKIDSGRLSTEYNYRDVHDGENGFVIPGR